MKQFKFFTLLLLCSCATAPKSSEVPEPHTESKSPRPFSKLWSVKLGGYIADLNAARNGSAILVATVPDRENGTSIKKPQLLLIDSEGKKKWTREAGTIRTQTLSQDGNLAAVSTYDDRVIAIDDKGNEMWAIDATCRPIILSKAHKIVCYHDEDVESDVAFDVLDWSGKKTLSYPIAENSLDILALKVSADERWVAMGFTQGEVSMAGAESQFKTKWKKKLPGEIVDLAVSPGAQPVTAVLLDTARKQKVVLLDFAGKVVSETPLKSHVEQIELSDDARSVIIYGTQPEAQLVTLFQVPGTLSGKAHPLKASWTQNPSPRADYAASAVLKNGELAIAFDDIQDPVRHSHVQVFDVTGNAPGALKWDVSVTTPTQDGAFLYLFDFAQPLLVVGMDDGRLNAYRLE